MAEAPWPQRYARRLAINDALVIAWAVAGAHAVRFGFVETDLPIGPFAPSYVLISVVLALVWWGTLALFDTRDPRFVGVGSEEYGHVLGASLRLFGLIAIAAYLAKVELARGYVGVAFPAGTLGLLVSRYLWRQWLVHQRAHGAFSSCVLVVGARDHASHLVKELARRPYAGYRVVGACVPGGIRGESLDGANVPIVGSLTSIAAAVDSCGADTVAVTASQGITPRALRQLGWDLEKRDVELVVAPSLTDVAGPRVHTRPVAGLPLLHVEAPRYEGATRFEKRTFDIVVSALCLLVFSPLLMAIALLVKFTSPGPILYRQERIGLNAEPFFMLKFRSMVVDADKRLAEILAANEGAGPLFKMKNDPRVTPVGRFLRRYSLDEMPQLLNVMKADMSLVGPRPPLAREVAEYADDVRRRLLVRPGITGLWQVSGRSDLSWDDSVRLDLFYVENWSLVSDVVILWKTAKAVVSPEGAY